MCCIHILFVYIIIHTAKGLHHVAYRILSQLDAQSLCRAELVCSDWYQVIDQGMLWKKLIEKKVQTDPVWRGLAERRGWYVLCYVHLCVRMWGLCHA